MRWQYRDTVLVVCTLALFVTVFGRVALSPIVPDAATEFRLSNAVIGLALTGIWFAYALTQFPSRVLAEWYSERPIVLAAVCGTGLATFVIVGVPGFVVFSLGAFLLGGLAGLHYSVAKRCSLASTATSGRRSHNSGAPLAGLVTPVVVSWTAVRYGWCPAIALTVIVAFAIFALALRSLRPTEPRRPDPPLSELLETGPILDLLSRPSIVFTGIIRSSQSLPSRVLRRSCRPFSPSITVIRRH